MKSGGRYGILAAAAALALVLVVADFVVAEINRSAQVEINSRQQYINQGIELSRVNQALVRAIAVAAVKDKDSKLGTLLNDQGITVSTAPSATRPPSTSPNTTGGSSN